VILRENRKRILGLAHALETHKTLTGDDVIAVIDGTPGPLVDGTPYADGEFIRQLEEYHLCAATAHRTHSKVPMAMPMPSVNGSSDAVPQGVTATLEPPDWLSGNGEAPSPDSSG